MLVVTLWFRTIPVARTVDYGFTGKRTNRPTDPLSQVKRRKISCSGTVGLMMVRRSMLLTIVCCLAVLSASAVVAFRADASPRDGQSAAAVHDRADLVTVGPRATIRSSSVDLPRAPMTGVAVYAVPLAALALAGLVASH